MTRQSFDIINTGSSGGNAKKKSDLLDGLRHAARYSNGVRCSSRA